MFQFIANITKNSAKSAAYSSARETSGGLYSPGRPQKYYPSSGKGKEPPKKGGEYRIRDGKGRIRYIGETCNLRRRKNEHIRSGKLPASPKKNYSFEYKVANEHSTSAERRMHEREKIKKHKPTENKSRGGEGRIARKAS